jgi:hypothetical protein
MALKSEKKDIYSLADEYIDKQFHTVRGTNEKLREANDRQALERTMIFIGAYGRGMNDALQILKS